MIFLLCIAHLNVREDKDAGWKEHIGGRVDASYFFEYFSFFAGKLLEVFPDWFEAIVDIIFVSVSS